MWKKIIWSHCGFGSAFVGLFALSSCMSAGVDENKAKRLAIAEFHKQTDADIGKYVIDVRPSTTHRAWYVSFESRYHPEKVGDPIIFDDSYSAFVDMENGSVQFFDR